VHICCIYTYTRNHEPTTPAATPSPGIRCTATARDTLAKFYIEELCERTGVDLKKATVKDPPWNTALPLKFDDWNRWQFRNQNGPEFQGTWLFTFFFLGGNVKIWYSFFKRRSFVKKDMGASVCHLGSFGWACLKISQRPPKNRAWDPGVFSIQSSDCVSICINQWRKTKKDIGGVGQAMLALRYLLTFWVASIFGYHLTIEPQKLRRIAFHTNTMIIIRNYKWYPNGANIREPKFGIFRRNGIWEMYRNIVCSLASKDAVNATKKNIKVNAVIICWAFILVINVQLQGTLGPFALLNWQFPKFLDSQITENGFLSYITI